MNDEYRNMTTMIGAHVGTSWCAHCGREVSFDNGMWADNQATGDDSMWREVCDGNDSFPAVHEVATGVNE
jgi:hypothetical protein